MLLMEKYFSLKFKFKIKSGWSFINILLVLKTFIITSFIWVFFRAESFEKAKNILKACFFNNNTGIEKIDFIIPIVFVLVMIIFDVLFFNSRVDNKISTFKTVYRWIFYFVILFCLLIFSGTQKFTFIYFQF